jgi:flagellar protein FlgJ
MTTPSTIGSTTDVLLRARLQGPAQGAVVGKQTPADADSDTLKAAQQFESLLIHNMLKSMRRTTMAEDTPNERAMYDDMLDDHLATVMSEAGGFGVAEAIARQLRASQGDSKPLTEDQQRLRTIVSQEKFGEPVTSQATSTIASLQHNQASRLRMVSGLWQSNAKTTSTSPAHSQKSRFIQPLLPHAARNAQRLGTSPDAILAVAALESGWGQHTIRGGDGENTHNLFGIKATQHDDSYTENTTTEFVNGQEQHVSARFRTFASPAAAVDGFADFLLDNPRYQTALQHAADPERFLHELQNAGYATDPQYAEKAISVMRQIARHRQAP